MPDAKTRARTLATAAFLLGALACGDGTGPDRAGPPAHLAVLSGDAQQDTAGQQLAAPLVVKVTDAEERAVPNQLVNFVVVSGGGSVFAGAALTNAQGLAQERWTLGTSAADSQKVEVRAVDATTGAPLVFAAFRATAVPDAPTAMAAVGGATRTGVAGAGASDSLEVVLRDRYGNPVPDVTLTWSATAGGGTVTASGGTTRADGTARAAWALGPSVATQTARAAVGSLSVEFTVAAGVPTGLVIEKTAGDAQVDTVEQTLPAPLVVTVRLADGRPVQGVPVTWASAAGTLTPASGLTDALGRISAQRTLGRVARVQTVEAQVSGAGAVTFTATAVADAPASVAIREGEGQRGEAGSALLVPVGALVLDRFSNPAPGAAVTWTVTAGGGTLAPASATTDDAGVTRAAWTLGTTAGENRATATVAGTSLTATATATGYVGPAAAVVRIGGDGQSAYVGATLAESLGVRVTDVHGNPNPGVMVTFGVTSGGGTVVAAPPSGTESAKSLRVITDGAGVARVAWRLGPVVGAQAVTASTDGAPATTFDATGAVRHHSAVSVSNAVVCARGTDGVGRCWGKILPLTTPPSADVVAAGALIREQGFGCVVVTGGPPSCWGQNRTGVIGPLGADCGLHQPCYVGTPTPVPGAPVLTTLDASQHVCGIDVAGTPYCWGVNGLGQAGPTSGDVQCHSGGIGPPYTCNPTPTRTPGTYPSFSALSVGGSFNCALGGADAYCWGANHYGQLGDPLVARAELSFSETPRLVAGGLAFTQVSAGAEHACGIAAAGVAYCWGRNQAGRLGLGVTDTLRVAPTLVSGGMAFARVEAGGDFTCGLTAAGAAYCWGGNASGQLGDGTQMSRYTPAPAAPGLAFRSLSAGGATVCGVTTEDVLYCWGYDGAGQLGPAGPSARGTGSFSARPVPVP
jgi:hypothetical protein